MVGRTGRHRLVQQHRLVRRLLALLTATDPTGIITGYCFFCTASTAEQSMAESFFALRAHPNPEAYRVWARSAEGPYVADKGFEGAENHRRWQESYGARVIHPPKRNSRKPWSKRLRRWVTSMRQIVERRLRQALQRLRSVAGAAPRVERIASAFGSEDSSAQLLHLAQRPTRSSPT